MHVLVCINFLHSATHNCGLPNSNLTYFNGLINVTYINGDAYHGDPPIPRSTQIAFLCDQNAGVGHPEFLSESDHTYSFLWSTSYACPERAVECAVVNSDRQYDLSRWILVLSLFPSKPSSSFVYELSLSGWLSKLATATGSLLMNPPVHPRGSTSMCVPLSTLSPSHLAVTLRLLLVSPRCLALRCMLIALMGFPQGSLSFTESLLSQEEVVIPNLGKAVSGPVAISDTHLVLNYTGGSTCTMADGSLSTYSTILDLICIHQNQVSHISLCDIFPVPF